MATINSAGPMDDEPPRIGFAAMQHRDFFLLFIGKNCGFMALHAVLVAVAYQVYDITGNVLNLAWIGLATFAPAIGFALFTGYVADRYDRRLVIAICSASIMFASLLFMFVSFSGMKQVWPVFAILIILGTGRAFYQPASNSFVPNLVPKIELPNAIAWYTSANKICQTVGPALGGIIYGLSGPEVVYAGAAVLLGIGTISFLFIRTKNPRATPERPTLHNLLAGLRYVMEKKIVLGAISLDLFVVLLGGVTALFPVYAKDILNVGPEGAGLLRSAFAFGALLTGLALTRIAMQKDVGKILYVSVVIFGVATMVFGISEVFWLSLLAMFVVGAADMVSVNIRVSLIQLATPDDMRGRVNAVNSVFTGASNEIGEFRAGSMAALIGAVPAVLIGGVGSIAVAAFFWRAFPQLAKVQRMDRDL
ncbi:MAG: MFS transporter [Rhodospirillaceae bacterium]